MLRKSFQGLFILKFLRSHIAHILLPVMLSLVLCGSAIFVFLIPALEEIFMQEEKSMMRELVYSTCSQLAHLHSLEERGYLSREKAQRSGADLIRAMRYGAENKDYLWVIDTDALLLVHPFRPELEGHSQWDYQDPSGAYLFRESAVAARKKGEDFIAYQWQWKDDPSRIESKLSFVKHFEPWGWVVSTGIYTEDVKAKINAITKSIMRAGLILLVLIFLLSAYVIWRSWRIEKQKESILKELSESEKRFRQMAETIEEVFWLADLGQGKMLYLSPAFEGIWRLDPKAVYADIDQCYERIHPEDRPKIRQRFENLEGWDQQEYEYRITLPNGDLRWLRDRLFRIENGDETAFHVVGITEEISEKKKKERESQEAYKKLKANETELRALYSQLKASESELREKERMLSTLMSNLPGVVYRCKDDANYSMEFISEGCESLLGYPPEALIENRTLTFLSLIHSEGRERLREEIRLADLEERPFSVEYRIQCADGRTKWVMEKGRHVAGPTPNSQRLEGFITDITQRKYAEDELSHSERRFRILFEHASDAILILDREAHIVDVNLQAYRSFGYAQGEMLGESFQRFVTTDDFGMVQQHLHPASSREGAIFECDCLRKNGAVFPMEINITSLPFGEGGSLLCSCRDITDRRRTQEAVERHLALLTAPDQDESSFSLSDLFDLQALQKIQDSFALGAKVASIICTPSGEAITAPSNYRHFCHTIMQCDPNFPVACMMNTEEAVSSPESQSSPQCRQGVWHAYVPLEVGENVLAHWYIGQVPDSHTEEESLRRFAQGKGLNEEAFMAAVAETPAMDEEEFSNVFKALVEIAHQISTLALKNIYQARAIEARRNAESERLRLVTAIEQTAEAIIIIDPQRIVHYANPAFEYISGYALDEVLEKPAETFFNAAHKQELLDEINACIRAGQGWKGHMSNRRKDKTAYEVDVVISPIYDKRDAIVDFVLVARDVTHEIALESQLRQSQKMEAIGTLAGGIAHDFNNILYAVLGYTELSMQGLETSSETYINLQEVMKAGHRATELINQILTFSRKSEQEKSPLRLQTVLKEALKLVRGSLPSTIEIQIHLDEECGLVMADPTQMHQVLMNLSTNAFQAMREEGGVLEVSLNEVLVNNTIASKHPDLHSGHYACISVRDTGLGMRPEVAERIFEPYFTTKKSGDGTGLGLATVHGIIKAHGGAITVFSQEGQGSTFNVFLPLHTKGKTAKAPAKPDLVDLFGSERLLVLDDEKPIVNMLQRSLQHFGYEVIAFTDSQEALEAFQKDPDHFDAIITDQTMPRLTGTQFAARLLKIRPDLPIILCTGFSESITPKKARKMGIREFIRKPVVPQDLAQAVRLALANKIHHVH